MERILNIPSVISHSYFTFFGKKELLSEKEINYFFSLLYLYRENLTEESLQQIFKKDGNKSKINEEFENVSVDIKLLQLQKLGVVGNYVYDDFKKFVIKLTNRRIVINTLGKDKRFDTQPMKMIEEYSFSKKHLHIKFTKEFLYLFLHTDEYFMKVDLNILFNIRGKKSKRLYLIIKDYINMDNQCIKITKEKLEDIVGKIPSYNEESDSKHKKNFFQIFDNINTVTEEKSSDTNISDVYVGYPKLDGELHKKYVFNFYNLLNDEEVDEIDEEEIEDDEYKKVKERYDFMGIDIENFTLQQIEDIENDVSKRFDKMKKNGFKAKNMEGYLVTMLRNEFIKLKPSKSEFELDKIITESVSYFKELEDGRYVDDKNQIFTVYLQINDETNYFLTDDYLLTNEFNDSITKNSDDTLEKINKWKKNKKLNYNIRNIFSKSMLKMCLLSEDELRRRGRIL